MKTVFFVLNGESQDYFIQQPNAEKFVIDNGGELFSEEIADKRFNELKKQGDFFKDIQPEEPVQEPQIKKEDLQKIIKQLQTENEQLKKVHKLSYKEASELFRKKAELLSTIGKFETINTRLREIDLKASDKDDLNTDRYRLVLQGGNYSKDEILGISNITVISDFIVFISEKVNTKISTLKAEVQEL